MKSNDEKFDLIKKVIEKNGIEFGDQLYQCDYILEKLPEVVLEICQIIYDKPDF